MAWTSLPPEDAVSSDPRDAGDHHPRPRLRHRPPWHHGEGHLDLGEGLAGTVGTLNLIKNVHSGNFGLYL